MAQNGTLSNLKPGVYLLKGENSSPLKEWNAQTQWNQITLGEFVAPESCTQSATVFHEAPALALSDEDLKISATIASANIPDSVLIYPAHVSMYNPHNPSYKMEWISGYTYSANIPAEVLHGSAFSYTITVFSGIQKVTFPANTNQNPLDWDYTSNAYYTTQLQSSDKPVILVDESSYASLETYMLPEWHQIHRNEVQETPSDKKLLSINFESNKAEPEFFIRKYLGDEWAQLGNKMKSATTLCIQLKETTDDMEIGFVSSNGFTYMASIPTGSNGVIRIQLDKLKQTKTALLPVSYPSFMHRYFTPEVQLPFLPEDIETFEIRMEGKQGIPSTITLGSIWLE